MEKVNLGEKFNLIDKYWSPKIVGELNGQVVEIAKIKGEFIWHKHEEEDELFLVLKGRLVIKLRDRDIAHPIVFFLWAVCIEKRHVCLEVFVILLRIRLVGFILPYSQLVNDGLLYVFVKLVCCLGSRHPYLPGFQRLNL